MKFALIPLKSSALRSKNRLRYKKAVPDSDQARAKNASLAILFSLQFSSLFLLWPPLPAERAKILPNWVRPINIWLNKSKNPPPDSAHRNFYHTNFAHEKGLNRPLCGGAIRQPHVSSEEKREARPPFLLQFGPVFQKIGN